jgi:2-phospho-L-lactate guanylyltransferase
LSTAPGTASNAQLSGTHALIPLKPPSVGKTRLSGALAAPLRARLSATMLRDVVERVQATARIAQVHVLTRDQADVPAGCKHLADPGLELNQALVSAARALRASGARSLLVLAADVPFATAEELGAVVAAAAPGVLVAAPDWRGRGTNGLLWDLSDPVTPCFGAGSLAAHERMAVSAGLAFTPIVRPGLALDIDEPAQLRTLAQHGGPSYAFLL